MAYPDPFDPLAFEAHVAGARPADTDPDAAAREIAWIDRQMDDLLDEALSVRIEMRQVLSLVLATAFLLIAVAGLLSQAASLASILLSAALILWDFRSYAAFVSRNTVVRSAVRRLRERRQELRSVGASPPR
jgi:hypothetical protein